MTASTALPPQYQALLDQASGASSASPTAASSPSSSATQLPAPYADLLAAASKPTANPYAGKKTGMVANFGAGANDVIAGTLGAPVDAVTWGLNKGIEGIDRATGAEIPQISNPVAGSDWWKRGMGLAHVNPDDVAPATPMQQLARGAGGGTAAMLLPVGGVPGSALDAARLGGLGAISGAGGQLAANAVPAPYKPLAAVAGALGAGGLAAGAGSVGKLAAKPFQSAPAVATKVMSHFKAGAPDIGNDQEIVPGSQPTLAESSGNSNVAGLQRTLRDINPAPFVAREQQNAEARKNFFANAAGTPDDIDAAIEARDQIALPKLNAAFANAGQANPAVVNRAINRILQSPAGQRDVVQKALTNIQQKLFVDNPLSDRIGRAIGPINDALSSGQLGAQNQADFTEARRLLNSAQRGYTSEEDLTSGLNKLATKQKIVGPLDNALSIIKEGDTRFQDDPAQLYGIRQAITDKLSPLASGDGSDARLAARQLGVVKAGIDGAIEKAAPGFRDYLNTYSTMSKPIDQMRFLQGLNLTDAQGNIQLGKVQSALRNVQKMQGARGVNPAKSLTPDQIGVLTRLRDDLLRQKNTALGKPAGSPTVQNAINQYGLGRAGVYAGKANTTIGAIAGAMLGSHLPFGLGEEAGAGLGAMLGNAAKNKIAARATAIRGELEKSMLNPGYGLSLPVAQSPSAGRYLYRQGLLPLLSAQPSPVAQREP